MPLPEPLGSERVERLARELDGGAGVAPAVDMGRAGPAGRMERVARGLARRVVGPLLDRAAAPGRKIGGEALEQVESLDRSLDSIRTAATEWEMERSTLRSGLVNQEQLTGEVRGLAAALEQLGRAIAPAFGLSEAATALAELRERVTACERRLRFLESGGHHRESAMAGPDSPVSRPHVPASTLFDYAGFERRFRGTPEDVLASLDLRYGDLLAASPPVLDIGCGRAELIGLMAARGVKAMGIDTDPSMVADARERGLDVVLSDALEFLRSQPAATFGSIVATHVLEHLDLDTLIELLELCATRLTAGGLFIAETPNPASLIVLGNSYILDPTHVRPLHPKLLEFLCEAAGFRNLEVRFFAPATGLQIERLPDADATPWIAHVNRAFDHLNHVLFGPQDYAIVASAAPQVR